MGLIYRQTVTILRAPLVVDAYGNQVPDWAAAARAEHRRVSVQPAGQTEPADAQRDETLTRWRVIGRSGVDIDVAATDRVELGDGTVCEVVGRPARWPDPVNGRLDHVEFACQAVQG